jgi:hypothetical protein
MHSSYITETIARQRLAQTARSAEGYAALRPPARAGRRTRPSLSWHVGARARLA